MPNKEGGFGTAAIPFGPPIFGLLTATIHTISPNPNVTIAR